MRRSAESLCRAGLALLGCVLLAGCVTAPAPQVLLTPEAEARLLGGLDAFSLDGRASVTAGAERFTPGFSWRQRGAQGRVRLSGPLGVGGLELTFGPEGALTVASGGDALRGEQAAALIARDLGFVPPFDALRYWMLGLPAPADGAVATRDAQGRLATLAQDGWQIVYERWTEQATPQGMARLPQRLTASRDDLSLRVVVDRWRLR